MLRLLVLPYRPVVLPSHERAALHQLRRHLCSLIAGYYLRGASGQRRPSTIGSSQKNIYLVHINKLNKLLTSHRPSLGIGLVKRSIGTSEMRTGNEGSINARFLLSILKITPWSQIAHWIKYIPKAASAYSIKLYLCLGCHIILATYKKYYLILESWLNFRGRNRTWLLSRTGVSTVLNQQI